MAIRKKDDKDDQVDEAEVEQVPQELGPVVPEGGEAESFEQVGSITGVQPVEDDDIPEAGR